MSQVLTPIALEYLDGTHWKLLLSYACVSDQLGRLDLPAGFLTDFNSVPRPLWAIFPPAQYAEAALPHDYLYRAGTHAGHPITRAQADAVHREFLVWRRAPGWKVRLMYAALRLGGWRAWRRYRAQAPAPAGTP